MAIIVRETLRRRFALLQLVTQKQFLRITRSFLGLISNLRFNAPFRNSIEHFAICSGFDKKKLSYSINIRLLLDVVIV